MSPIKVSTEKRPSGRASARDLQHWAAANAASSTSISRSIDVGERSVRLVFGVMRVTVGMIVEALAAGRTIEPLLFDFPYLEEEDIREALAFARLAPGHEIRLAS